jgi:hypothetical protein
MKPRVDKSEREWTVAEMELLVEEAWRRLDGVSASGRGWPATLRDGIEELLALLSERPAFARVALIEAPVAGGRPEALYRSSKGALLTFLERGAELGGPDVPASAARGALAGAETLVVGEILAGRAGRLGELAVDVTYMLAVPYLGRATAQRLSKAPAGRGRLRAVA